MKMVLWLHFIHHFPGAFYYLFYRKAEQSIEPYILLKYKQDFLSCSPWLWLSVSGGATLIMSKNHQSKPKALRYHEYEHGMKNIIGRWADWMERICWAFLQVQASYTVKKYSVRLSLNAKYTSETGLVGLKV